MVARHDERLDPGCMALGDCFVYAFARRICHTDETEKSDVPFDFLDHIVPATWIEGAARYGEYAESLFRELLIYRLDFFPVVLGDRFQFAFPVDKFADRKHAIRRSLHCELFVVIELSYRTHSLAFRVEG